MSGLETGFDSEGQEMELEVAPDPDHLDQEWCLQPRLRIFWGRRLADAKRDLAQAKAELEVVEAELYQGIRSNPNEYGLDKITEASIRNVLVLQKSYKMALDRLIEQQHAVDVVQAAVSAIDHKKSALEELVRLRLADYYSECKAPEGAKEEMEEMSKSMLRSRERGR